jgi:hypothetical protein
MGSHLAAKFGYGWPVIIVDAVRATRRFFAWFSQNTVVGVPLDWPLRFVLIGALYMLLCRWTTRRRAAVFAASLLIAKEALDIFAHLDLLAPRPPDWGDAADCAAGLLGIAAAELFFRVRSRSRPAHPGPAGD